MAAATGPRKTISVHEYPEHLNPFREEDNHNKIRFWTIGKKLNRSNSINFSGIKELKNSWAFRSFMRKGKKGQQTSKVSDTNDSNKHVTSNGENSPVMFRRALNYSSFSTGSRSTVASPERYVYGGSITPLPRSRFQERLRSPSQHEVNSLSVTPRMARSEITGSRLSVESTNPFDEVPIPPVRASRRKKKRAPAPPGVADTSICSTNSELQISEIDEKNVTKSESELKTDNLEIDDTKLNIELKIVEEVDVKQEVVENTNEVTKPTDETKQVNEVVLAYNVTEEKPKESTEELMRRSDSEDDILDKSMFPKIDIVKYRRNSSLDEDDMRLRRGNLEEIHAMSNKRCKSLNNSLNSSFVTFDINLNESKRGIDTNGNAEPQKVVCKVYDEPRKLSIDNSISSTEKEFIEIDRATRELEREISKLNSALLYEEDVVVASRMSVSDIRRRFDKSDVSSPNPIPKPRRSHYGDSPSPVNGNLHT